MMSGIIKKSFSLFLIMACFCGCKHYAPFPELDNDGILKADAENVAYDSSAPIIGSKEINKTQSKVVSSQKNTEANSVVSAKKENTAVKPVVAKKTPQKASETVKIAENKKAAVAASDDKKNLNNSNPQGKKDLSKPNPEIDDSIADDAVVIVPSKTTSSVITDMDLTEMDAQDKVIKSKIIKPVSKTATIVPVKKEIKEVMPKKDVVSEPSIFYLAETIYFNNGGSVVDSRYYNSLKKIVKEAKAHNGKVVVQGFASSRTRNADMMTHKMANLKVSVARAEKVADLLVKYGMPRSKIITEGLSDSRPVYLEVMPEGERLNRRAEVYISY